MLIIQEYSGSELFVTQYSNEVNRRWKHWTFVLYCFSLNRIFFVFRSRTPYVMKHWHRCNTSVRTAHFCVNIHHENFYFKWLLFWQKNTIRSISIINTENTFHILLNEWTQKSSSVRVCQLSDTKLCMYIFLILANSNLLLICLLVKTNFNFKQSKLNLYCINAKGLKYSALPNNWQFFFQAK